jgi:hypothetical protein
MQSLLRSDIFCAEEVKTSVLFFESKRGAKDPWTKTVSLYGVIIATWAHDEAHS